MLLLTTCRRFLLRNLAFTMSGAGSGVASSACLTRRARAKVWGCPRVIMGLPIMAQKLSSA